MGSSVTLVDSDSATKPLTDFMLNRRVDVPASASAPGRPGDWSVDGEKLYLCLDPDDWSAVALVKVSSSVEVVADVATDGDGFDEAEASDSSYADDQDSNEEVSDSSDAGDQDSNEEVK